jgi:alkanesulfonate monooxygenase SsuD/methylene tetrahydromethanopterin reductase-like flavin-dependent oxidoreductase (luciferase family)
MVSQTESSPAVITTPIYGIAISDELTVDLIRNGTSQTLAALQSILDTTLAGVIYVGGGRFIPGDHIQRVDPIFTAQWLLNRFPRATALVSTSPEVEHPFNYARHSLALDHFTKGRLGIVIGARDLGTGLVTDGNSVWSDSATGAELAGDFAAVLRKLWNNWPLNSIISDKESGVFADSAQIVEVNHTGRYNIRGPVNAPSSIQGEPPLGWHLTADPQEQKYLTDAEIIISTAPPVAPRGSQQLQLILRRLEKINTPDGDTAAQLGQGSLLQLDSEEAVTHAAAALEPLVRWQQNGSTGPTAPRQGTLRERLGLGPRSLDISGYQPAFATEQSIGGSL